MTKYIKNFEAIEATQWFKNGDHPLDSKEKIDFGKFRGNLVEGTIVQPYRNADLDGEVKCGRCINQMQEHGVIINKYWSCVVCPSDYVITLKDGEYYSCHYSIFKRLYRKF